MASPQPTLLRAPEELDPIATAKSRIEDAWKSIEEARARFLGDANEAFVEDAKKAFLRAAVPGYSAMRTQHLAPTSTAASFASCIIEQLLAPWPGGRLLSRPIAEALASAVTRVHTLAGAHTGGAAPFDRWLATVVGSPDLRLTGEPLGRYAADRVLAIIGSATSAPARLAATSLPPPSGPPLPLPIPALPGFLPPGRWNEQAVIRALLSLGKIGVLEVATLNQRLAVATAMSGIAVAMPGIRSTRFVGNVVHPKLQGTYIGAYAPPHLIVADRKVWGGLPPASGTPLAEAAAGGPPQLGALYLAWLNTRWVSSRRSDLTDLSRLANCEIKPLLQAPLGVLQEAWYRCSYNWVAENLAATNPALAGQFGWLLPGPPWELSLMRPVPLSPIGGHAAMAIPFTTMALPGLVVYAVVSGPAMIDLAILVALLIQLIEREIRRLPAGVAAALEALGRAIEAVARWLAENLIVIVAFLALAGLAAVSAKALAVAALATAVLFIISQVRRRGEPEEPQTAVAAAPVTLDFAGVSVRLPALDVPWFCAALEPIAAGAFRQLADSMRTSLGAAGVA